MQVLLFVKYPHPGQVKTRLAADIGAENAAMLYRAFVRDELAMLAALGLRPHICCAPNAKLVLFRQWLGVQYSYEHQVGGDLGERMRDALARAMARHRSVLLLGSDVPDLPADIVCQARHTLDSAVVCLGPAVDGGYYAVGVSAAQPLEWLFTDITWSTPQVLEVTCARCVAHGLAPDLLPLWADVDTLADLRHCLSRAPQTLSTVDHASGIVPHFFQKSVVKA